MEVKPKSFRVLQNQLRELEKELKNKKTNEELEHLQNLKAKDLTNHRESSVCLRIKFDSARFSLDDSETSSAIS